MPTPATPAVSNTCGGALVGGAAAGNTIGITGGSIAAGSSCPVSVNISAAAATPPVSFYNQTGSVRANEGVGVDSADTLYVTNRATLTKSFAPATVLVNVDSTMTIVVENNHTAGITTIAFSDAFPAGLVVGPAPRVPQPPSRTGTAGGPASPR